jgi:succinate-semialdehyde dehydrogenase/glutarate-semialdehyde dehydrogenase
MSNLLTSFNPANGEIVGTAPVFTSEQVHQAVTAARKAQAPWGALTTRQRAQEMRALQPVLVRCAEEIAQTEIAEQGKTQVEAYGSVLASIHLLNYYRKTAPRVLRSRRPWPLMGLLRAHRIYYEPFGVVGIIAPGNYPFSLSMEPLLAALIAGNGVVLKPSETTPLVGMKIGEIFRAAGFPAGLVQVVTGDGSTGAALIRSGIDRLVFTGSVATGRKVAALAGEHLVPVTLELGGKDAAIVLADADLKRAASGIAWGGTLNAGQACLAVERVYVEEAVADPFIERLTEAMRELRVGPGTGDVDIAAITTEAQMQIIESHVADAVDKGARLLCGGQRLPGDGRFYQPTVLSQVSDDMIVMREETFGPVVAVQRVANAEEAVRRTNASPFGLTASIWTRDIGRGRRLADQIQVGDVAVNEHGSSAGNAEIPWGGVKDSGYGRTRGEEGIRSMTVTKHISWPRFQTGREPFWYPYSPTMVKVIKKAIRLLYGSWAVRLRTILEILGIN